MATGLDQCPRPTFPRPRLPLFDPKKKSCGCNLQSAQLDQCAATRNLTADIRLIPPSENGTISLFNKFCDWSFLCDIFSFLESCLDGINLQNSQTAQCIQSFLESFHLGDCLGLDGLGVGTCWLTNLLLRASQLFEFAPSRPFLLGPKH